MSKHQHVLFFTERQKELLKNTNGSLRQLNRDVRGHLRRIGRSTLTHKQYRDAGLSLGSLATRMTHVLRLRNEILISAREQGPDRIELHFSSICSDCGFTPRNADNSPGNPDHVPQLDATHSADLDRLVQIAHEMGERVRLRTVPPRIIPNIFSVGLNRLTDALLRQRKHPGYSSESTAAGDCAYLKPWHLRGLPQTTSSIRSK